IKFAVSNLQCVVGVEECVMFGITVDGITVDHVLWVAVCAVVTGALIIAVILGFVLVKSLQRHRESVTSAQKELAQRVERYNHQQTRLQDIVVTLNHEMKRMKNLVQEQQLVHEQQLAQRTVYGDGVKDYERLAGLFSCGQVDVSMAQAMGLSRAEAELVAHMAKANAAFRKPERA
ncbi:MAG: hypothetical protein P8144_02020, partial [Gammaproteobacteria bacterium]